MIPQKNWNSSQLNTQTC